MCVADFLPWQSVGCVSLFDYCMLSLPLSHLIYFLLVINFLALPLLPLVVLSSFFCVANLLCLFLFFVPQSLLTHTFSTSLLLSRCAMRRYQVSGDDDRADRHLVPAALLLPAAHVLHRQPRHERRRQQKTRTHAVLLCSLFSCCVFACVFGLCGCG